MAKEKKKSAWSTGSLRNAIFQELIASGGQTTGLMSRLSQELNVSRPTLSKLIKKLAKEEWLTVSGPVHRPVYTFGKNRWIAHVYSRKQVNDEDLLWLKDFSPYLELPSNVKDIARHGFTEILNNAHDHSGGSKVYVQVSIYKGNLVIFISDDGIGIFKKISSALNLPDERLAILELSKGKLTTDPDNHSGEGIFFTSRMFDFFQIEANGLLFAHTAKIEEDILTETEGLFGGTTVTMLMSLDSKRTTKEVFDQFTDCTDELNFSKTIVPVRLAKLEGEKLISRSQGKRLVARFDGFRYVILDFDEVDEIGQAFADEVFRVFQRAHPNVTLAPLNATEEVSKMIRRVQVSM